MGGGTGTHQGGASIGAELMGVGAVGSGVVGNEGAETAVPGSIDRQAVLLEATDARLRAGNSNVTYIGKEPTLVMRNGDLLNPVQQGMCAGTCDSFAEVSGRIIISMQYLFATGGNFSLTGEARCQGDIKFSAERPGAVGGSMRAGIEAKILGLEVTDTDAQGGGFADKTLIISHAQSHPLKVEFGRGMNSMQQVDIEVCSGVPGADGVIVNNTEQSFIDVDDRLDESGVRVITLTAGRPPSA